MEKAWCVEYYKFVALLCFMREQGEICRNNQEEEGNYKKPQLKYYEN